MLGKYFAIFKARKSHKTSTEWNQPNGNRFMFEIGNGYAAKDIKISFSI